MYWSTKIAGLQIRIKFNFNNTVFKHYMFISLYIVNKNRAKRHGRPCFLTVQ